MHWLWASEHATLLALCAKVYRRRIA
jgi:hypothetical protein